MAFRDVRVLGPSNTSTVVTGKSGSLFGKFGVIIRRFPTHIGRGLFSSSRPKPKPIREMGSFK